MDNNPVVYFLPNRDAKPRLADILEFGGRRSDDTRRGGNLRFLQGVLGVLRELRVVYG